jgi:two-component sensor histidine kinase/PAS domain-containing protein
MTTYLGTAMIVIIWCTVFYLAHEEYEEAAELAVRQGTNLARIFEEYIARVVGGADATLLALREFYQHDPQHFDILRLTSQTLSKENSVVQFAIIGADGRYMLGTQSSTPQNSVDDRNYFRFQAHAKTDELYIGTPMIGHLSGRPIFVLARRITTLDGSFGGLIVATIDILRVEEFYNSIDIGHGGSISLMGFDGIVRARGTRNPAANDLVGKSASQTKLFALFPSYPWGHYWNFENSARPIDGIRRLVSYWVVEGLPLIATVGLAESDIFEQSISTSRKYYFIAFSLTVCVIWAMAFGAQRQRTLSSTMAALEQSKLSLEQVNLWLNVALKNMAHGLSMFDKDQRLILCNERYGEMYGIAPERTKPGTTLRAILEARRAVGNSKGNAEDCARTFRVSEPSYAENKLSDGRIIASNYQPMPDGGWVAVHQEITERRRAEEHQQLLLSELDHRVKNILARVAVVAMYTRQGSNSMDEFIRALDGRIQSMADAHTLLSESRWRGASLADLVRRQLAPYTTTTNTVISGPDITLSAAATQALAMVLQELVTNAVKYGSLSVPHGKVSVNWDRQDGAPHLMIAWRETNGQPITAPNHSSYGTKLIRGLIPRELGGTVDVAFAPEGLRCEIEIPLNEAQIAGRD